MQEELRAFTRIEADRAKELAEAQSDTTAEQVMDEQGLAAFDDGQALLREALSSRVWTPTQAQQMRGILPKLPQERGRELLDQLFSAMRRGEIKSDGPPI